MLFNWANQRYFCCVATQLHHGEKIYRGIPVSAGVCRGKVIVLRQTRPSIAQQQLSEAELANEINRLEQALVQTRHQILEVQRKVSERMGAQEGTIFEAHLLVLEDRTLLDEVVRVIQQEKVNAEHAFHSVAERYAATLAAWFGVPPASLSQVFPNLANFNAPTLGFV